MGRWRQQTHNFVLLALITLLTTVAIAVLVLGEIRRLSL